ncbi:hypothetical protein NOC27_2638 [Nitrosococcus oceani AFC27]|nr:hypothetical protein NOC27_2638 [Nitrosococcus oceani AFC27]
MSGWLTAQGISRISSSYKKEGSIYFPIHYTKMGGNEWSCI